MIENAKICQVLLQKAAGNIVAKKYGWDDCPLRVQYVIALFDNQTWERIAITAEYYKETSTTQPKLSWKLRTKTRSEASQIIDEYIATNKIFGKSLIIEKS